MSPSSIRTPDQRLRVFVSSTLRELAPERETVRATVERLRFIPVMFELGARPHPPRSLYRSYLEQSDVFIGIYWESYGWVAEGEDVSGIEDEYRLGSRLPQLLYVKEPATNRQLELQRMLDTVQADDRASYRRFSSPHELAELVADDLAVVVSERFARLSASAADEPMVEAAERRAERALDRERYEEARTELEPIAGSHPLRGRTQLLLLRALTGVGQTSEALRRFEEYRDRLSAEVGLEPPEELQQLARRLEHSRSTGPEAWPIAHDGPSTGLAQLRINYVTRHDGAAIAVGTVGTGPSVLSVPAWVTSLDIIMAGRDPRSSLLERLAREVELTLYDRYGTGLSRGPVDDYSLETSIDELEAIAEHLDRPSALLAFSGAGPIAVGLAARRPELVTHLILFGTYANGPALFPDADLRSGWTAMVKAGGAFGLRMLARLYRPGASEEGERFLGSALLGAAPTDVAAEYLESIFDTDVTDRLADVACPALVIHYRDDRLFPIAGGRQLAAGLPRARFLPLDGRWHLPDVADLDVVMREVRGFLSGASAEGA